MCGTQINQEDGIMNNYRFNELLKEEMPMYKAVNNGMETLTNVELLSLIIGRGTDPQRSVIQARQLLAISGGRLRNLAGKRLEELEVVQGVGDCKAMALQAAMELGKRYFMEEPSQKPELCSADAIYRYMRPHVISLCVEEAHVLYLRQNLSLIKHERVSRGGLTETAVDVRVIIREAVLCGATAVVLCHNHPSGSRRPSIYDDRLTKGVKQACDTMRIHFVDHVIVTADGFYSYQDEGRI